ncbi:hypothetical protein [Pedobacter antarcticus]|uniref:hypothetical protein n=1 Tax=Pedobacter antarcticus TaxID=34086 RepID=UPI001C55BF13|nr:hypothetical protein [Pedobacter antarcticus]
MKTLLLIFSLLTASFSLKAQQDVVIGHWDFKEISKAAGKEVVIVDSVYDGRTFDNHTLLNVGGKYPGQIISVFIAKNDYHNFDGDILSLYLHKKISVSGKISMYKDKAQIIVTNPKQLNSHLDWNPKVLNVIL